MTINTVIEELLRVALVPGYIPEEIQQVSSGRGDNGISVLVLPAGWQSESDGPPYVRVADGHSDESRRAHEFFRFSSLRNTLTQQPQIDFFWQASSLQIPTLFWRVRC